MKIAIDVSAVIYGTGVSVYTRRLVQSLLKIDAKNDYIIFGGSLRRKTELEDFAKGLDGKFETKFSLLAPSLADVLSNRLDILAVEKLVGKVDVYHSSDWAQFKAHAFKVTTVHDLAPILFPKETHPKIVEVHNRRLHKVLREEDRVIVPSQATQKDLVKFGLSENKIRVIPEALSLDFSHVSQEQIERAKKKFKLHGNYSLSVGTVKRKNIGRIIAAFEKASGRTELGQHVVVGAGEAHGGRGVRFTGHISESELVALYMGASVLVYASIYEGFGLPILEAFAAGIPVVTSNISSMPEIAGNAAVLVDPTNIDAISNGIIEAINNKQLLVAKGSKQLKKFSWEKSARETLKVYEESQK